MAELLLIDGRSALVDDNVLPEVQAFTWHQHRRGFICRWTPRNGTKSKLIQLSWPKILKEIKKCRLVCANCHNMRHGGEW